VIPQAKRDQPTRSQHHFQERPIVSILWFRRALLVLATLAVSIVIFQTGYFFWMLARGRHLGPADLIVSFEGTDSRSQAAYELLDRGYAPNLLISPATPRKLSFYEKRYRPTRPYTHILDEQSRTTAENAILTHQRMLENRFQSVILVTSWDHMPRSFFLLKLQTAFSGITIYPYCVGTGKLEAANWYRHRSGWKMVYNEMVQFWGSLIELAQYKLRGELPEEAPGQSPLATRLKQLFLFDIDHQVLSR
jgi:hypothetical protein